MHHDRMLAQSLVPLFAVLTLNGCSRDNPLFGIEGDETNDSDGTNGGDDINGSGGTNLSGGTGSSGDTDSSGGSVANETYFKSIRVLASGVSGPQSLENFPLFVSLVDADLHDRAQADGCDIAFYQGSTLLDFELEDFDAEYTNAEARLTAWVRIPQMAVMEDTEITVHYGLPCEPRENRAGVWGDDYALVWHMNSTDTAQDSSVNGFDGVLIGRPTIEDGKLGHSLMLDGVDDRIEGPLASELGVLESATRTFSVWANLQHYESTPFGNIFGIGRLGGGCCVYQGYGISRGGYDLSFTVGGEWTQNANWIIFDDGTGFDEWVYYAAVYDGATGLAIYANGTLITEVTLKNPLNTLDENRLQLPYSSNYLIGGLRDEMRISRRVMTSDWIATEYANQNDPESFYEVGPEIAQPAQ